MFLFYSDELQIGGIYIRIYNEQPTFPIHNCASFVIDLLEYLKQAYQYFVGRRQPTSGQILQPTLAANHPHILQPTRVHQQPPPVPVRSDFDGVLNEYQRAKARSAKNETSGGNPAAATGPRYDFAGNPKAVEHLLMTLRSFVSVIKANANLEIQCVGHFEMLFGFLSTSLCGPSADREVKSLALDIVSLVSRNKDCVQEIAGCELLGNFLVALRDRDLNTLEDRVLDTLSGLLNGQRMVKEAQNKGAVSYLLDLFVGSRTPSIRVQCAEILGKMTADKLTGPKVRISVSKFLPTVFLDAMIENPAISVQMFESTQEHPELIWNETTRTRVTSAISQMAER